jgi:hypothetical protein
MARWISTAHFDGGDRACELDQRAVAHQLHDTAAARRDRGIDQLAAVGFQPGERPRLVRAHETRIADHVGGEDGRQSALQAHGPKRSSGRRSKPAELICRRRARL